MGHPPHIRRLLVFFATLAPAGELAAPSLEAGVPALPDLYVLFIGTQARIDRFEAGQRTGHWQSQFNAKGHQVWGIAIRGDAVTCSEGSDNEKHWMKATLADFKPAQ